MRKKAKEITVVADYYTVLLCQEHSGEQINWKKEFQIRDHIRCDKGRSSFYNEESEFEDRLLSERGFLETVKYDSWSNEPYLYSFEVWYEYKLNIGYTYNNQSYETQVEYETDRGRIPDKCRLDITFPDTEPQKVLSVSEHQESVLSDFFCRIRKWLHRRG